MITLASALTFPQIDPVIFTIGPFAIHWYAVAYILGLMFAWRYVLHLIKRPGAVLTPLQVEDIIVWGTFGIIVGGRLGYVLFYNADFYFDNPGKIIAVWDGGMSFHGGFSGVAVAIIGYSLRHKLSMLAVGDLFACAAPVGLFLGRIANFVNSELWGRPTDVPWAFVFPNGGPLARHPSQLYEAGLEGIGLFVLIWLLYRFTRLIERPGALVGVFLIGYAAARTVVELFRQPDAQIGYLAGGVTMGQVLSMPMAAVGIYLLIRALRGQKVDRSGS